MSSASIGIGIPGSVARKIALFQVQGTDGECHTTGSGTLRLRRKDGIKRKKSKCSGTKMEASDVDFSDSSSSACAPSTISTDSCYGGSSIYDEQWNMTLKPCNKGRRNSSDYLNLMTSSSNGTRRLKDCYYQSFTLPRRPGKLVLQAVEFSDLCVQGQEDAAIGAGEVENLSAEALYEDLEKIYQSEASCPTNEEDDARPPSPPPYESIYAEPIYGENGSSGGSSSYWSPSSSIYSSGNNHNNVLLNNTSIAPPAVPSLQSRVTLTPFDLEAPQLPPLPVPNQSSHHKFSSIAKSAGRRLVRKFDIIRRLSRASSIDGSSFSLSLTPSPLPPSCPRPNQASSLYNLSQSSSSSLNPSTPGHNDISGVPSKVKKPVSRPRIPPPEPPPPVRSSTLDRKSSRNGRSLTNNNVPNNRKWDADSRNERRYPESTQSGHSFDDIEIQNRRLEDSNLQNGQDALYSENSQIGRSLDIEDFEDSDFCDSDSELIRNFVSAVQPIYSMEEEPLYQYYTYGISLQPEDDYQPVIPKNLGLTLEMLMPRQGQRTLWCQIPEVLNSGILAILSDKQKQLQESIFEILTSEVSYLKSLDVLIGLFYANQDLTQLLSDSDRAALFGNIKAVKESSRLFLKELMAKWEESWYIHEVGNLIRQNSENRFSVYVDYCRNKPYQDRTLQRLRNGCDEFLNVIRSIEEDRKCENLRMDSFLMLPMQRITRLPLLVNAIIQRTQHVKEKSDCEAALHSLTNLVIECNEAARESQDLEETERIMEKLEFHRGLRPLPNPGQFLLKGDFMKNPFETGRGTTKLNWTFQKSKRTYYCLILFMQQLYITKKRSSGKLEVIEMISPRDAYIKGLPTLEGISKEFHHYFMLHFEGRDTVYFLAGRTQSEVDRWSQKLDHIRTVKNLRVKAIFSYEAEREDELSFLIGEVIQVSQKQPDGWYFGTKENGDEGWFPGNYAIDA